MLELEALGHGLDHQLAGRERGEIVHRLQALGRGLRLLGRETPLARFFLQAVPRPPQPLLERLRERVVQQRAGARAAGELGDARAHRARAEHADDTRGAHLRQGPAR